jgi:hypothetical protein
VGEPSAPLSGVESSIILAQITLPGNKPPMCPKSTIWNGWGDACVARSGD